MMKMLTDEIRQLLIEQAQDAWQRAYAPYSEYAVGAALLTDTGKIFQGVNIENAVYPLTVCGERVAVFKAVSEGEKAFKAIAVVTKNGGSPCGSCRQVLAEFGLDTVVLIADTQGNLRDELTVGELLPHSFGQADLDAARD
ncbi:MAG: cytidine deaminase [Brevefilum sp.]